MSKLLTTVTTTYHLMVLDTVQNTLHHHQEI